MVTGMKTVFANFSMSGKESESSLFVGYSCMWESFYCSKLVHLVAIFGNVSVVQVFTVSLNREKEASGKLYAVFKLTFV